MGAQANANANAELSMNAQPILDKILSDAREAAAAIAKDAQQRAADMQKQNEKNIEDQRQQVMARARQDAVEQEERMLRMAQLEERKALLAAKRALMDRAFDAALTKLHAMPAQEARAFLLALAVQTAQGGEEIIVGMPVPAWFDDAFVGDVNAQLIKAGKQPIQAGARDAAVRGGFMLSKDGLELNCTYEALLKTQRMALEGEVAAMLFP